jgi:hypothetical protein
MLLDPDDRPFNLISQNPVETAGTPARLLLTFIAIPIAPQPLGQPTWAEDPEAAQLADEADLEKPLWAHPSGVLFALSPLDHFQVLAATLAVGSGTWRRSGYMHARLLSQWPYGCPTLCTAQSVKPA